MKRSTGFSILSIIVLLLGVGFFGISNSFNMNAGSVQTLDNDFKLEDGDGLYQSFLSFMQNKKYGHVFDFHDFALLEDIYRVDDFIEAVPFLITQHQDIFLDINNNATHAVAGDQLFYQIDQSKIVDFLKESNSFESFINKMRIDIIGFLIELGYDNFEIKPYLKEVANDAIVQKGSDFVFLKDVDKKDGLDVLLEKKLELWEKDFAKIQKFGTYLNYHTITFTAKDYKYLGKLLMFKNEQDLRDLGYELISWRTRVNMDPIYRRHNISTAFANIGHVRMLMPGEEFSLRKGLRYSMYNPGSEIFMDGYATVGNGVELVYGGGLCGAATAFYQGTLTNLGLDLLEYKPHSIYYRNLYEGELNGEYVSEPGLESTVYAPYYDVRVQNIRDYPIIMVFNYDGLSGSIEQMFTLAKTQDRGSFSFVEKYKKGRSQCFVRNVKGENRTSCYNSIKDF